MVNINTIKMSNSLCQSKVFFFSLDSVYGNNNTFPYLNLMT